MGGSVDERKISSLRVSRDATRSMVSLFQERNAKTSAYKFVSADPSYVSCSSQLFSCCPAH